MDENLVDNCGSTPSYLCEWIFDETNNAALARLADWFIDRPLRIVLIGIAAWVINRVVRSLIGRGLDRFIEARGRESDFMTNARSRAGLPDKPDPNEAQLDALERTPQRTQTLASVLKSTATVLIYTFAGLTMLGELNINLGPLIAGAGIAGIALGFGAQSMVKDFLAGIFILMEDQYGVGDIVDLGPATGTVERISLRATRMRDLDGTVWVIPNGEVHRVGNLSQLWARSVLDIEVAYETDVAFATQILQRVADAAYGADLDKATILEPPEVLGVQDLGPNSVVIRLAVKTEASEQFAVSRYLRGAIKAEFDKEGINIPFPQRTLWVHNVD